jgi:Histidine kinase-, DNA gyrase B-, and HSP90-like ATPase
VVRHAGASRCLIAVTMNGALEVSVADNGSGPGDHVGHGVGWTSMRERAAELGGSCTITRRPEGGTLVRAVLPLPEPPLPEPPLGEPPLGEPPLGEPPLPEPPARPWADTARAERS